MNDIKWFKRVSVRFALVVYMIIGLSYTYPQILKVLFWPFHYGPTGH